jgi:hypothetical protein
MFQRKKFLDDSKPNPHYSSLSFAFSPWDYFSLESHVLSKIDFLVFVENIF